MSRSRNSLGEVLAQLAVGGAAPGRRSAPPNREITHRSCASAGCPGFVEPALDELLERGPARQAVLAGDGQLSVVQGAELAGGQAALGFQLR